MIRRRILDGMLPVLDYYVSNNTLRQSYNQDAIDTFWDMLSMDDVFRDDRRDNRTIKMIQWCIDRRVQYSIEMVSADTALYFDYNHLYWSEGVEFYLVVRDPDDALLFKLTWGGE